MKAAGWFACGMVCVLGISAARAQSTARPGDWPQWRGPQREGIADAGGLRRSWPEGGPPVVWHVDSVGVGYSSVVVADGRVITQGDLDGVEHVIALDERDGSLLWAVQPQPVADALAARIREEFTRLDADGDGSIREAEALPRLGPGFYVYDAASDDDPEIVAAKRAEGILSAFDTDGDARLGFDEGKVFQDTFSRIDREDPAADVELLAQARMQADLDALDSDQDGFVSQDEARGTRLDRPFRRIDQRPEGSDRGDERLSAEEIRAYYAQREPGRDGELTRDELVAFYRDSHAGKDGVLTEVELRSMFGGFRNDQGDGPRGTPTVDGDRVYVEGGNGDVTCLEAATGRTIWHVNLVSDLGGGRPGWGFSESPLVEGDLLIVTPGGSQGTVAALDKRTGEVVWRSTEVTEGAHYSSAVAADIRGVRQIVQFARENLMGLDARDGKLLWKYGHAANGTANCFTPIVHDDHAFASSAYGTGSGLVRIVGEGTELQAEEVYFLDRLQSHHGGAVRIGDYLYSNGGGNTMCVDYLSGEIVWQDRGVGKGALIAADGMLYVLSERHEIALVQATPEEYVETGRFAIESHGRPSWAHPVVAHGRLYLRDQGSLTVYDVSDPAAGK